MLRDIYIEKLKERGFIFNDYGKLEGFFNFPVSSLVTINFDDSSVCAFRHAFTEKINNHLVVFTEHCGYHVFGLGMIESVVYSTD